MKRLLLWLALAGPAAAAPGLDSPEPVAPFLDAIFPTTTPGPTGSWAVADAFPNLTFTDPVRMVKDPRGPEHVYIVCRNGEVWRIPFRNSATQAEKVRVLDRRANTWGWWDAGMMSICFHPDFGKPGDPNRGYVYVFYQYVPQQPSPQSVGSPSYMRLSRFTVPDGQVAFDPASEFVLIQQFDRHNWHNGGQMFFGPDRFLHVVVGDEGDANDSHGVAQKIDDRLFSGILRIDVDRDPARSHPIRRQPRTIARPSGWPASFTQGYSIPNDNPWQDPAGAILEEFWTIGTRSPHSMHFDDETGEIWIAEVGQGAREEITVARKAGNHQWPFKEGFVNGPKSKPANLIGTEVPPVYDYPRSIGGCVIGGIVYRGTAHLAALDGKYIFGDHNTRALYSLKRVDGGPPQVEYLTSVNRSGGDKRGLAGICEGPDGEVYFMELGDNGTNTGKILKLVRNGTPVADPPQWLSQTGAFSDIATLTPRSGLMPFGVNAALWTDGAVKSRWIAVPNDGSHDTAAEQVTYREEGAFDFPVGTVLVKHFALPVDARDPSVVEPVETRFLVHGTSGWYGVTYRWNEDGTDAELLPGGATRDFTITAEDGSQHVQRWSFPSRSDCRTCHTAEAGHVLGARSHQLNGSYTYPQTGRIANQLETWNALGIFGMSFGGREPAALPRSVDPHDPHASLDHRVRSYLDSNCSHCHHPGGVTANFDARFSTRLIAQNFVGGAVNRPFHSPHERVVKAGDPALSLLHIRNAAVGAGQMPPLGKNVVDAAAVALIEDWIRGLDEATFTATTPAERGIEGNYYAGRNFGAPAFTRTDAAIDFDWGSGSPGGSLGVDDFSVRWRAWIVPPAAGSYTFFTTTDDGVRLWIDGTLVIDKWQDQSPTEHSGSITLTGDPVEMVMEYYENGGGAVAKLAWSGPGLAKQIIPASAFFSTFGENAGPVAEDDDFEATHAAVAPLDVLGNDSDDSLPGIHGIAIVTPPRHGTVRISGAQKRLIYTHAGTGRHDSFQYTLTDPHGETSAPATVALFMPYDFAAWAAETPGADGNPASNGDGDLFPDLLEFALGGDPASGADAGGIEIEADGNDISLVLRRPEGRDGVSYAIETSADLASWNDAGELLPAGEVFRLDGLQHQPGLSADHGFARLRVTGGGASIATLPLGWRAVTLAEPRSFGIPFRNPPVFSSAVVGMDGLTLHVHGEPPATFSGYVEVIAGDHAGHRFEATGIADGEVLLRAEGPHTLAPVPDLTGQRIVLSAHHTLGGVFDKDAFVGSTNPAAADQVQMYLNDGVSPPGFVLYYLLDARPNNPAHQWRAFLPGGGNQDDRPIRPGQGVFVKRPPDAAPVRLLLTGQVRANRFVQPLQPGVNLVGSPFPLPLTPRLRGLLDPAAGFVPSTNLNAADQVHLHRDGAFRIYYFLDHPSLPDYWREAVPASPNANDLPLFSPDEAVFLKRSAASPLHAVPQPWTP